MSKEIDRLLEIMEFLRSPEGCPWDREQTFKSIAPSTIEEAYEVAEAVENNDMQALREELGDLLLQVVFYAQMAKEKGLFDFYDIVESLSAKLIKRHPHVFGKKEKLETGAAVRQQWEEGKAVKRAAAKKDGIQQSLLDGIATALPPSLRALKISQRLATVGFDWQTARDVMAKFCEEFTELEKEVLSNDSKEKIAEELGDVMFALINLARHLGIDADAALRECNRKVERRWRAIESLLARKGKTVQQSNIEELEKLWREVKTNEK